jgi:hypothetical protein
MKLALEYYFNTVGDIRNKVYRVDGNTLQNTGKIYENIQWS